MPTKASITTRTAKGSPLSTAEMDANLTNLRDQSIGFADDGSTVISVDSGNTITIAGAGTVSTALSGTTLTVTGAGITASSSDTLTNKTIDANGTGNSITNLEVADFAGSAIITVAETLAANDSDTAVVTAGAIIDYVDAQDANIASDSLTFTNKTIDANGTGNSITNLEVADLAAGVLDTDLTAVSASDDTLASAKAIKTYADTKLANVVEDTTPQLGGSLDVNSQQIVSTANGNIVLAPNGTGTVQVNNSRLEVFDDTDALDFANYGTPSINIQDTTSGAEMGLVHYVTGPAVGGTGSNVQFLYLQHDTTGTYSMPDSTASNGDIATAFGYNFTDNYNTVFSQGGELYLSAYGVNVDGGAAWAPDAYEDNYAPQNIIIGDDSNDAGHTGVLKLEHPLVKYQEKVTTLTDDSTTDIHIDCRTGTVSTFSLNDNKTFVFTNLDAGRTHTLIITNQGAFTATLQGSDSSAIKFPGGAPTITATQGAIDVITVFYDGTNYLGNIAQNFS